MLSEVRFEKKRWNLKDVLPDHKGEEFERTLAGVEKAAKSLEALRPMLSNFTRQEVDEQMLWAESLKRSMHRLRAYASMLFASDTGDEEARALLDRVVELSASIENRVLFLELFWIGLDDARAESILPANADYAHYLKTLRKLRPHALEEKVEQAINIKNTTGFVGWVLHYEKLVSGFEFGLAVRGRPVLDPSGKPKRFTGSEISKFFVSSDPDEREASYRSHLATFGEKGPIIGDVYRTLVRDWRNENVELRKYKTPISPRNLENDVADETVEALLSVCRKNAPVFQQFFEMKAKVLKMPAMARYHIYAPVADEGKKYSYPDAVSMVLTAYSDFDRRFGELAYRVFDSDHVDSEERKGKQSGAFCYAVSPDLVPYMHLNYAGTLRDVYTLAHETGHAIHDQLASKHSVFTYSPTLVMAETASVFGEMVLFDRFMRSESDPAIKKAMLIDKISSTYATIGRQAYFVIFEKDAHEMVSKGATTPELCSVYLANLREQFGESVEVPDEFRWEWTAIPHIFHTPFYCYSYAFGNLLSLALYDAYTREGKDFVPKYEKILSYGSAASPPDILAEVGVDISSESFWQAGFDVIRRMVDEAARL
ncbi:MAG TPA: M3 family oligoendopeptidase [Nitrososphaerales archaeon]|nr:M3 family oligoendopeptidase [Nitrososphaerales archaeon]